MPEIPSQTRAESLAERLMQAIERDGDMSAEERYHLTFEVLYEVLRLSRKIEQETLLGIFKHDPIKTAAVVTGGFIALHEFSTFINVHQVLVVILKLLGVPVS